MDFLEVLGYIAIGFFGIVGFVLTALAVGEYVGTQFKLFVPKVGKEIEVRKEHINAQGEAKKIRLAKKRAVKEAIKDKKMDNQINRIKTKANENFGEAVFELPPPPEPIYTEPLVHTPIPLEAPAPTAVPAPAAPTARPIIKAAPKVE